MIKTASIKNLSDTFHQVDTNKDGKISKQELKDAISRERVDYSSDEVDKIFTAIDTNNSGMIEFSEFLTASIERNLQLCQ